MRILGFALSLVAGAVLAGETAHGKAVPGSVAPEFKLVDQAGNTISLSGLKGKIVVLEWVNPGCPFWIRHAQAGTMKKLSEQYAARGIVWLGVNSTSFMSREGNQEARAEYALSYPILDDSAGRTGRAYGAKTTPHMYVLDSKGRIAYAGAIDDDPRGTKGAMAVNYVRLALEDLLAGRKVVTPETKPYGCSIKYAKKGK